MRLDYCHPCLAKERRELDRDVRLAARGAPALHHFFGEGFHPRTARHEPKHFVVAVLMKNRDAAGPKRAGDVADELRRRDDKRRDPATPGEIEVC